MVKSSSQYLPRGGPRRPLRRDAIVLAVNSLERVWAGENLEHVLASIRNDPYRALVRDICYGATRYHYSLQERLNPLVNRPFHQLDGCIQVLLVVCAYQLQYTRVKAHALVSEAVHATRSLGFGSASGLVNAVLRKYTRTGETQSSEAEYEAPGWMIARLTADYPSCWQEILSNSLTRAPLTLRVNKQLTTSERYQATLSQANLSFTVGANPSTISLAQPVPQTEIPRVDDGFVSVQDAHSQLAVDLLQIEDGVRVLDACAAPGVKTTQLLDASTKIDLTSIDINEPRTRWFYSQPEQLTRQHRITIADATNLTWWDGVPFQRVLLDAPCTSTGTLRRHPDVKLHRTEADILAAQTLQLSLLENIWQTLADHATLLYCTCSLFAAENQDVVRTFAKSRSDLRVLKLEIDGGLVSDWGTQLLPQAGGGDGFFFAKLMREPTRT